MVGEVAWAVLPVALEGSVQGTSGEVEVPGSKLKARQVKRERLLSGRHGIAMDGKAHRPDPVREVCGQQLQGRRPGVEGLSPFPGRRTLEQTQPRRRADRLVRVQASGDDLETTVETPLSMPVDVSGNQEFDIPIADPSRQPGPAFLSQTVQGIVCDQHMATRLGMGARRALHPRSLGLGQGPARRVRQQHQYAAPGHHPTLRRA